MDDDDLVMRTDLHVEVNLPDWLDTNPSVEDLRRAYVEHARVAQMAQRGVEMIRAKLFSYS